MARNEMLAVIIIGLVIFAFCLVLLAFGSFYGGNWEIVAQAVAKYVVVLTVIGIGIYVLFSIAGRR